MVWRVVATWLATLAMLVQFAAVPASALAGTARFAAFPICHAAGAAPPAAALSIRDLERASPAGSLPGDPPDRPQEGCPFCATCCHAAVALPDAIALVMPSTIARRVETLRPRARLVVATRRSFAASPRGPPRQA